MKKNLLLALSLSVIFFACSKEDAPQEVSTTGKKIPLKVSITDFIKKQEALPSPYGKVKPATGLKDSSLAGKITDVYFNITNQDGFNVARIHQQSQDSGFGVITQFLPSGNYSVVAMAASAPLIVYDPTYSIYPLIENDKITVGFPDIFRNKVDITVSEDDSASIEMLLQREVGFLEVNITDAPADVPDSAVTVKLSHEFQSYDIITAYGWFVNENIGVMDLPRRDQNIFSNFVLNTRTELTVEINYPDRESSTMLTKTIRHIKLTKNTKTILTGSLYTTPPSAELPNNGFSIGINDIWDPSQVIDF